MDNQPLDNQVSADSSSGAPAPSPSSLNGGPKKSLFDAQPKHTFIFGLITGVAVLGLVGTIVFGLMYFKGGTANTKTAGTGNTINTPSQEIKLAEVTDKDHVRGPKDAKITVIEYSDLECPFCKSFHPTMKQLMSAYDGKIRWIFRHFPIVQLHSKAPKEAEAAECANEQGKFWEFIDKVYEVTPGNDRLDPAELPKIAQQVGVSDLAKFQSCLSSGKYENVVQADLQSGLDAGVQGTPASFINGEPVYGAVPFAQLKAGVDKLLTQ